MKNNLQLKMKYIYIAIIASIFSVGSLKAQTESNDSLQNTLFSNIDYQVKAQFSIGGSSPLGLPEEIRKIDSYNPTLQMGLEANATKWFSDAQKWGVRLGVRFEGKGMETKARVKNYRTEIIQGGDKVAGYYTGSVKTTVKNTYVTFPISAVYNINQNWNIYGGVYLSAAIDKTFDGYVSDGYLRQGIPTGDKIVFSGDSQAAYDFSDEVNNFQWGTQIGGEWKMNKHFKLFADVSYGFNPVLNKDFEAISFSMHNIYLNLGFGYQF